MFISDAFQLYCNCYWYMLIFVRNVFPDSFCKTYNLSYERLMEIRECQFDLLQNLVDIGCLKSVSEGLDVSTTGKAPPNATAHIFTRGVTGSVDVGGNNRIAESTGLAALCYVNRNSFRPRLLNAVFCAGLYPQLVCCCKPF